MGHDRGNKLERNSIGKDTPPVKTETQYETPVSTGISVSIPIRDGTKQDASEIATALAIFLETHSQEQLEELTRLLSHPDYDSIAVRTRMYRLTTPQPSWCVRILIEDAGSADIDDLRRGLHLLATNPDDEKMVHWAGAQVASSGPSKSRAVIQLYDHRNADDQTVISEWHINTSAQSEMVPV